MELEGKIAIVTGASNGLGKACAEKLAEARAEVIVCSRNKKGLGTVQSQIIKNHGRCEYFVVDVSKKQEVDKFIDKVIASHKRIDVIINNAGTIHDKKLIEEITDKEYESCMKTNIDSIFYFLRKVVPIMKKQNSGMIVNISSGAGLRGHPKFSVYSASKFAVIGFTQSVAKELEGTNVSCIAICPGGINTDMRTRLFGKEDASLQQKPEIVAEILKNVILGKIVVPNGASVSIRNGEITEIKPM